MRLIDYVRLFEADDLTMFLMAVGTASRGSHTINESIDIQRKLLKDNDPEFTKIFNDVVNKLNTEIEV